jgi:hypothetical protein
VHTCWPCGQRGCDIRKGLLRRAVCVCVRARARAFMTAGSGEGCGGGGRGNTHSPTARTGTGLAWPGLDACFLDPRCDEPPRSLVVDLLALGGEAISSARLPPFAFIRRSSRACSSLSRAISSWCCFASIVPGAVQCACVSVCHCDCAPAATTQVEVADAEHVPGALLKRPPLLLFPEGLGPARVGLLVELAPPPPLEAPVL